MRGAVRTVDACLWGALLEARSAVAAGPAGYRVVAVGSCRARSGGRSSPRKLQTISRSVSRVAHLPVKKMWSRSPPSPPVRGGSLISVTVRVRTVRDRAPWSMRKSSGPVFSNLPSRGASEEGGAACSMLGAGGAERRRALPALRGHTRATLHTTHTHTPARMTATHRIGEARITVIGRHAVGRHAAEHVELPASSFR